jgi:hypothetical protein
LSWENGLVDLLRHRLIMEVPTIEVMNAATTLSLRSIQHSLLIFDEQATLLLLEKAKH